MSYKGERGSLRSFEVPVPSIYLGELHGRAPVCLFALLFRSSHWLQGPGSMANLSQCLDDQPSGFLWPRQWDETALLQRDLYSEAQRLAVEQLLAGGREAFWSFLKREKVVPFLSEEEIDAILASAILPAGEEGAELSMLSASMDCSSVTYFPDRSDVEPPPLELGWPAFCAGSYRGVTRAEVLFQPNYGESIYSCKEAVRRLIRGAKEVIAVVMDSFTDIDIFRDIQEACRKRRVPAYILLDHAGLPHFLKMCQHLEVSPEEEKLLKVRTITGNTYYTRTGAKIIGKVREKFLLVDGMKAATGSYSFTWTDGKLNSSNVLVLSGQVVEHFDMQFRILFAQSKAINPKLVVNPKSIGTFDHLLGRNLPSRPFVMSNFLKLELNKLASTPKKMEEQLAKNAEKASRLSDASITSIIGEEDWLRDRDLVCDSKETTTTSTQTEPWEEWRHVEVSDTGTQTSVATMATATQTHVAAKVASTQTLVLSKTITTQTERDESLKYSLEQRNKVTEQSQPYGRSSTVSSSSSSSSSSTSTIGSTSSNGSHCSMQSTDYLGYGNYAGVHRSDYTLRDCFKKLTKERQYHYTTIRSKLDHMVSILSKRNRLADSYVGQAAGNYNLKRRNELHGSFLSLREVSLYAPGK
ncbi:protein FAM83D [Ambystoma mexicanum]|uniref:protein FAM83D n=1 Tax=Ambystoma mexicanum TaxID=8296 RepID=UPI0037E771E0